MAFSLYHLWILSKTPLWAVCLFSFWNHNQMIQFLSVYLQLLPFWCWDLWILRDAVFRSCFLLPSLVRLVSSCHPLTRFNFLDKPERLSHPVPPSQYLGLSLHWSACLSWPQVFSPQSWSDSQVRSQTSILALNRSASFGLLRDFHDPLHTSADLGLSQLLSYSFRWPPFFDCSQVFSRHFSWFCSFSTPQDYLVN